MAKELTLELARELLHYCPDTGIFTWKKYRGSRAQAGARAGHLNQDGYRYIRIGCRDYSEHWLAFFLMLGRWPADEVDHENGAKSDNRWENLREATHAENMANRGLQKNNTSGFKGVRRVKATGRWETRISLNKKRIHLGSYATKEEAHAAYMRASVAYHQDFARAS